MILIFDQVILGGQMDGVSGLAAIDDLQAFYMNSGIILRGVVQFIANDGDTVIKVKEFMALIVGKCSSYILIVYSYLRDYFLSKMHEHFYRIDIRRAYYRVARSPLWALAPLRFSQRPRRS